jgi:hypothetical protein
MGGPSIAWGIWAVVNSRDDPPAYLGGLKDIVVDKDLTQTVEVAPLFGDEEGDDLLFALSATAPGVTMERTTGWLRVDGRENINLTDVHVIAYESKNQSRSAVSQPFAIRVIRPALLETPAPTPPTDYFGGWGLPLILVAVLGAAGAFALAYLWRREEEEEDSADANVDSLVESLGRGEAWESVAMQRPQPVRPPAVDDPQMLELEQEWARVIASRHTDASTTPGDIEGDLDTRGHRRKVGAPSPPEQGTAPERPAKMTSSDTETERRAGEIDTELDVKRRRRAP